jgi:Kef-type K+ transport system membrane component KefB
MSFGVLTVIVLAGLAGPLLTATGRRYVPVVVGEILAGLVVGRTGLGIVNPTNETVAFLGLIGFAMLMLAAGMHVPLRDPRLRASLGGGAMLAALVGLLAVPAGLIASEIAGTGHAAVYAVVLASGSAAVVLPTLEEHSTLTASALTAMAQVTVADIVTILTVPIALSPSRVGHVALGALLVAAAAIAFLALAHWLRRFDWVHALRRRSKEEHWALDLRVALVVLFLLAWLAQKSGTSVLIAGFGAGLLVAYVGGPKRLSTQVRGVADGFFVPLYFVVLGAQLDVTGLFRHPSALALAGALCALTVAIHTLAALLLRHSQGVALVTCAQLGVPAAVASLGLSEGVISPVVATAIVFSALVSLAVSAAGVVVLDRQASATLAS